MFTRNSFSDESEFLNRMSPKAKENSENIVAYIEKGEEIKVYKSNRFPSFIANKTGWYVHPSKDVVAFRSAMGDPRLLEFYCE